MICTQLSPITNQDSKGRNFEQNYSCLIILELNQIN